GEPHLRGERAALCLVLGEQAARGDEVGDTAEAAPGTGDVFRPPNTMNTTPEPWFRSRPAP
ncbi:hypothetical protein, partial [Streptomyces sp. NPDC001980]|uniref:hypothetical protein n=1 Tax=Streptomyces sp. NPDC001980 TaxID=3157126 RepID=UPI003331447D